MAIAQAIHRIEEFMRTFKVGDRFWSMRSYHGRPHDIVGPLEILQVFKDEEGEWRIVYVDHGSGYKSSTTYPEYVSDKVNPANGVFMSRTAAFGYFREKYAEHISNPELVREYKRNVAISLMKLELPSSFS
ncbi:MAG: hypothetical protein WDZ40_03535 [Candidatus Spechtbacterales bacterium]